MLHIPRWVQNFISVSKMGDAGLQTMFEKDTCKLVQGEMVFLRGIRIMTLYKLLGRNDTSSYHPKVILETEEISSFIVDSTMLWHRQLGHISEKGLRSMHSKGIVEGFFNCSSKFDFCEQCVYGKQNRVSFSTKVTTVKIILELVHSDAFGPVSVPSLGGSRYYVSFTDNFSRVTWLYFLKKKLEVFEKFLEFKFLVEN